MIDAWRSVQFILVRVRKKREVLAQIIDDNSFEDEQETLYFIGDCRQMQDGLTKENNFFWKELYLPKKWV
jgi:tRNA threonylcarbamoyladenosine biosynthesis protein TsaB